MSAPTTAAPPRSAARRWALRALWTVAGLALAAMTLWCGVYFWLGSSPGRAQVLTDLGLPDALRIGALRWGPAWDEVTLGDVVIDAPDGRPLMRAPAVALDLDLGALAGGDIVVDALTIEVSQLAATQKDGKLELAAALTPPRPPTTASGTGAAKPRAPPPEVKRVDVYVHELWVDLPEVQAHVRDLRVTGAVPRSEPAALRVATGPCHASWNKGRRYVGFDECRAALRVQGQRLEVEALELEHDGAFIAMQGQTDMDGDKARGAFRAWGALGAREADTFAPGSFPAGVDIDGLTLSFVGGELEGALGSLVAPRWSAGPLSAEHVALAVERFTAEPGLIVPAMELTVSGLSAARFEGLGWSLEGLALSRIGATLDKRLVAEANGWSSAWTLPSGEVRPVDLRLATSLKLTGGALEAQVESDDGVVLALGTLKSSPLTKRTDFVAELFYADVRGPLAVALAHDMDDATRDALGERFGGTAELEVEVEREDRFAPWQTTLEWALGRIESRAGAGGATGTGPAANTVVAWDGYGWGAPAPEPAPEPPPEEPP